MGSSKAVISSALQGSVMAPARPKDDVLVDKTKSLVRTTGCPKKNDNTFNRNLFLYYNLNLYVFNMD